MEQLSDETVAAILGLLAPVDRHRLAPVCMQWDRVVRSMQHRLSFDFSQLSGSAIGSEGEAESREDTHAAVEALLAGTSLRAVVWLQVANLQRQAQDVALQQLAALLRHTLWISQLTALRCLTLVDPPGVPDRLGQLAALTHLSLCGPCDGEWRVPPCITALRDLRELRVWSACLEGEVGALGALPSLCQLDLHESHVPHLAWLQALTRLTYLKLNHLNNWTTPHSPEAWDAALRPLTRLVHLDLEANELQVLPPCVTQLAAVTALRLAFNCLRSLPPGPYLASLQRLDIACTPIKDLPVPAGSSRKQGCSACLSPPPPALRALCHLSLSSSDGLPPPADQRRLLRQLAGLPSLAVLDLGEHELDAYGAALQQQLSALQLNCYQLGCD
ncbi:hypothetical protein D9Q98_010609 [Chlorella vulgaris]|uniref:Uncharacterized protein n=1 Tax=Chlorella vulgaris TaxID=3077 RepID=A0A9D4TQT3_CHLVU|nr:hypothetical protein D9Q98_010609 [Chlorella vulgaris]